MRDAVTTGNHPSVFERAGPIGPKGLAEAADLLSSCSGLSAQRTVEAITTVLPRFPRTPALVHVGNRRVLEACRPHLLCRGLGIARPQMRSEALRPFFRGDVGKNETVTGLRLSKSLDGVRSFNRGKGPCSQKSQKPERLSQLAPAPNPTLKMYSN